MDVLVIWIWFFKKCVFNPVPHILIRLIIYLQLNILCTLYIFIHAANEKIALQNFPYNLLVAFTF
jgi:hypothetical protein